MNVVCYHSSRIGMVPPLTSQTLRHISFQTSMDLHLSVVVNRAERPNSSKSTILESNKTVKVCLSAKKNCHSDSEQQKVSKNRKTAEPVDAL